MYLKDFRDSLAKVLDDEIHVAINETYIDNEDLIFGTLIRRRRLITSGENGVDRLRITVCIGKSKQLILSGILKEFDSCCGKLILHKIIANSGYYHAAIKDGLKEISDENYQKGVKLFIGLIEEITKTLEYASLQFIISEIEQPSLSNAIKNTNYVPSSSFINYRMSPKNKCNEYIINFEK